MSLSVSEESALPPVHLFRARVGGESTKEGHERDVCVTAVFDKYTASTHISYSEYPGFHCPINILIDNRNYRTQLSPSSSRTATTAYSTSTWNLTTDAT
jgi:hypothetical protein